MKIFQFFHIFLGLYMLLVFSFYFLFKPLYIIMVLNWAFNTMYTAKSLSYYMSCIAVYISVALFLTFNILQLKISLKFQDYLEFLSTRTDVKFSVSGSFGESTMSVSGNSAEEMRRTSPLPSKTNYSCRMLNEPPTISINKILVSGPLDNRGIR